MTDEWESIFSGVIESRPVKVEIYDDGGYRVLSTQGSDPGTVHSDRSATILIPPTERGRAVSIKGETREEILRDLLADGFSEAAGKKNRRQTTGIAARKFV